MGGNPMQSLYDRPHYCDDARRELDYLNECFAAKGINFPTSGHLFPVDPFQKELEQIYPAWNNYEPNWHCLQSLPDEKGRYVMVREYRPSEFGWGVTYLSPRKKQ